MASHVFHFAVVAGIQPFLQVVLVLIEVDAGDAKLLEAKLLGPALQGVPQVSEVLAIDGERVCHVTIVTDSPGRFSSLIRIGCPCLAHTESG